MADYAVKNRRMGTSKAGVITIDFGRNICLTPEIMKILAETGNRAKNCSFIYKNKKYNLFIPIIYMNTNAYKDAMEVLKKEDNNRGFVGFMRVYEIYRDLGVTLQEIK